MAARIEKVKTLAADCRIPGLETGIAGGPGFPTSHSESGTAFIGKTVWDSEAPDSGASETWLSWKGKTT